MSKGLPAAGFILLLPILAGQNHELGGVLRFDVDLIQVDAVVTDRNGRHVPNLKQEAFEVL